MKGRRSLLQGNKTLISLEKAIERLETQDLSGVKKNVIFEKVNTRKGTNSIAASALNIEMFQTYSQKVKDATIKMNNRDNIVRIIDDANNLVIFKGTIRQPFRSVDDIYCKLFVNHKEYNDTEDTYQNILNHLKGTCIIVQE